MSISEDTVDGSGGLPSTPWDLPALVMPPDRSDDQDAFEDAVWEAQACGDAGFVDRMHAWWWPELDQAADVALPAPRCPDDESDRVPADPADRFGPAVLLQLAGRAKNQADAAFLAAVHQAGHATGGYTAAGFPRRDRFALPEIAAATEHSTAMAGYQLWLAEGVIERLPRLFEAMAAGWLDLAKAKVLVTDTTSMPADLAGMVVSSVLGRVAGLTNAELSAEIALAAGQLDPDWAERRERAALARARVEYVHTPAGTGEVLLRDMTAGARARIQARSSRLAAVLRDAARSMGLEVGLPGLRLLVCERLLDGSCVGLDDEALLEVLTEQLPAWNAHLTGHADASGGPDDNGPDDGGPGDGAPEDDGPDDNGPDDNGPVEPTAGSDGDGDGDGDGDEDEDGDGDRADPATGADRDATARGGGRGLAGGERLGTVELRLRLSTVLGLDELPATIPGAGPITAPSARRLLDTIRAEQSWIPTEYRLVLTTDDGYLDHVLLVRPDRMSTDRMSTDRMSTDRMSTDRAGADRGGAEPPDPRQRPAGPRGSPRPRGTGSGRARGTAIVELAAPTTLLAALDPEDHSAWAGMLRRARLQLARLPGRGEHAGGPHHPASTTADAHRRLPGAVLARYIRVRDRHCPGPMCRRPAHSAEIDHTRNWGHHGLTVAENLSPPCAHCHALKHEGGWTLDQPEPGRFTWHSPLGTTHTITPRRVLEPALGPSPRPGGRRRPVLDAGRRPRADDTGEKHRTARITTPSEIPSPPTTPIRDLADDEPPPF